MATVAFWVFTLVIPAKAVVYAWIYNDANYSIFAVVLFHALQDVAAELVSVDGAEAIEFAVWIGLAAIAAVGMIQR